MLRYVGSQYSTAVILRILFASPVRKARGLGVFLATAVLRTWAPGGEGEGGPPAHLRVGDGLQLGRPQLPQLLLVLPQIRLAANEHHGGPTAEMRDLGEPLQRERLGIRAGAGAVSVSEAPTPGGRPHLDEDVVIAGGVHDVIADEHQVGVLVG